MRNRSNLRKAIKHKPVTYVDCTCGFLIWRVGPVDSKVNDTAENPKRWAHVDERVYLPIPFRVEYVWHDMQHQSFLFDLKTMWLTAYWGFCAAGLSHRSV